MSSKMQLPEKWWYSPKSKTIIQICFKSHRKPNEVVSQKVKSKRVRKPNGYLQQKSAMKEATYICLLTVGCNKLMPHPLFSKESHCGELLCLPLGMSKPGAWRLCLVIRLLHRKRRFLWLISLKWILTYWVLRLTILKHRPAGATSPDSKWMVVISNWNKGWFLSSIWIIFKM